MRLCIAFEETRSEFQIGLEGDEELCVDMEEAIPGVEVDIYDGDYEVTPTAWDQTLQTAGKTLVEPVVVRKIPSNYGLITYSGSNITIS